MSATFVDYAIAIGLLVIGFAATVSFVSNFSTDYQTSVRQSTLHANAISLADLSQRDYAFDTISGLGLAARKVDTTSQPPREIIYISSAALQRIASKNYSSIREDFEFRIKLADENGSSVFNYGPIPPLSDNAVISRPVLYESGSEIKRGIFSVEVWQ